MANHNLPTLAGTSYADFLSQISARLTDVAQGLDPAVTTVTNPPPNAIRWTSSANRWEKWNGTAWVALSTGYAINLAGPTTLTANASGAALTITQTGSGNALVVEDQAGDSTPFVIDGNGTVLVGATSFENTSAGLAKVNVQALVTFSGRYQGVDASPATLALGKSRDVAIVQNNDETARMVFEGFDGSVFRRCASIAAFVDGVPGAGSMPGRLVLSTTPAGTAVPVERMRIDADGNVMIGTTTAVGAALSVVKPLNAATSIGVRSQPQIGGVVSEATLFYQQVRLDAGANVTSAYSYRAAGVNLGAGATLTNAYGFSVDSSLAFAVNNFGFHSSIPAAAGRWNFYAAGTAPNYFAGDLRTSTVVTQAVVPTNTNTSATLTAASLLQGLRTGTPTAAITYTLPTGANMDLAFTTLEANMAFEWSVINQAGVTHTITLAAATGHTVVGNMVVQPNTSGRFLTRKTAADTFITYRIA